MKSDSIKRMAAIFGAMACAASVWAMSPLDYTFLRVSPDGGDAVSPFTVDPQRRELLLVRKSICYPPKAGSGYRVMNCFVELDALPRGCP